MEKVMTKEEFAERWDSGDDGDGITFDEIADCAVSWGLFSTPKTQKIDKVAAAVVEASGSKDDY